MEIGSTRVTRGLVIVACLVSCLLTTPSSGQTVGGTFVGRVRDQSAATLPYANVSIVNVATGVATSVVTNADGFYSAPNLLPGTYAVTVAFDGFNSQTKSGLTLTVMSKSTGSSAPTVSVRPLLVWLLNPSNATVTV